MAARKKKAGRKKKATRKKGTRKKAATRKKSTRKKAARKKPPRKKAPQRGNGKANGQELPQAFLDAQWKPGQSGNPAGRPKGLSYEERVRKVMEETVPGMDLEKADAIARVFVDMLLRRNPAMHKELMAREWPVINKVEVTVPEADTARLDDCLADLIAEGGTDSAAGGNGTAGPNGSGGVPE